MWMVAVCYVKAFKYIDRIGTECNSINYTFSSLSRIGADDDNLTGSYLTAILILISLFPTSAPHPSFISVLSATFALSWFRNLWEHCLCHCCYTGLKTTAWPSQSLNQAQPSPFTSTTFQARPVVCLSKFAIKKFAGSRRKINIIMSNQKHVDWFVRGQKCLHQLKCEFLDWI